MSAKEKRRSSRGLAVSVVVVAFLVIAIILFVGYWVCFGTPIESPPNNFLSVIALVSMFFFVALGFWWIAKRHNNVKMPDQALDISVFAAALAFLAVTLYVAAEVLHEVKDPDAIKKLWIGLLSALATSVVVLVGTYLTTFSKLAQNVVGGLKRAGETSEIVANKVHQANDAIDKSSQELRRNYLSLAAQTTTRIAQGRFEEFQARQGLETSSALVDATGMHITALLNAAMQGGLLPGQHDKMMRDSGSSPMNLSTESSVAIAGLLHAFLTESAYDMSARQIATNVGNYARVLTGAALSLRQFLGNTVQVTGGNEDNMGFATKIEDGLAAGEPDPTETDAQEDGENEPEASSTQAKRSVFFLVNTVVAPAHLLNWPWSLEPGKYPFRFSPDFMLRYMTYMRLFARKDSGIIHARVISGLPERESGGDVDANGKTGPASDWESPLDCPMPPHVNFSDSPPCFSGPTYTDQTAFAPGPYIRDLPDEKKLASAQWHSAIMEVDKRRLATASASFRARATINEQYGANLTVWPLFEKAAKSDTCQSCPFNASSAKPGSTRCVNAIVEALLDYLSEPMRKHDLAPEWRGPIGKTSKDDLGVAELSEQLRNAPSGAHKAKALLGWLETFDTLRWTLAPTKDAKCDLDAAIRCLLVACNWLMAEDDSGNAFQDNGKSLNEWFAETFHSHKSLGVVLDREKYVKEISRNEDLSKKVDAAFSREFALIGTLTGDGNNPLALAGALEKYASQFDSVGGPGIPAEQGGSVPDCKVDTLVLVETVAEAPWRVVEIKWRGKRDGSTDSPNGTSALVLNRTDAEAIKAYADILRRATGANDPAVRLIKDMK